MGSTNAWLAFSKGPERCGIGLCSWRLHNVPNCHESPKIKGRVVKHLEWRGKLWNVGVISLYFRIPNIGGGTIPWVHLGRVRCALYWKRLNEYLESKKCELELSRGGKTGNMCSRTRPSQPRRIHSLPIFLPGTYTARAYAYPRHFWRDAWQRGWSVLLQTEFQLRLESPCTERSRAKSGRSETRY